MLCTTFQISLSMRTFEVHITPRMTAALEATELGRYRSRRASTPLLLSTNHTAFYMPIAFFIAGEGTIIENAACCRSVCVAAAASQPRSPLGAAGPILPTPGIMTRNKNSKYDSWRRFRPRT